MSLPSLLDDHFPTHGNWQGLSLGWVATIWLSSILSRGDHRLVHVEPWVGNRLWTLRATTGQAVERLDFTDDRLESVLHCLHDDTWHPSTVEAVVACASSVGLAQCVSGGAELGPTHRAPAVLRPMDVQ